MFRRALFYHALFSHDMFCHAPFCHALFSSVMFVVGAGGGATADSRWNWGSGGRGVQGGRAGRSVRKIYQPQTVECGTTLLCFCMVCSGCVAVL